MTAAGRRGPRRILETRSTREDRVPLSDDDREMEHSWRCIPVPPDGSGWFILDSSTDHRTTGGRWHDVEGSA
jgi:hypothetical protein